MSKKKKESLENFSRSDLKTKIVNYKKELFNLRFQKASGELKNTSRFSAVRKMIARINTHLNLEDK